MGPPAPMNANFYGEITTLPKVGHIKVCEAFNTSFYLSPQGYDDPKKSDAFCVAWLTKDTSALGTGVIGVIGALGASF
eukprot:6928441-Pyramimonas_sp.AAC.1